MKLAGGLRSGVSVGAAVRSVVRSPHTARQLLAPAVRNTRRSPLTAHALFGSTMSKESSIYDFSVKARLAIAREEDIDGRDTSLSKFKNKVLLVVNVASQCGFTPQYKDLAAVYDKYKSKGFEVLAFPSNQFGSQEPGSNAEIKQFAQARGAKFPLFSKVDVNGPGAEPLYNFLKDKQGGLLVSAIKWNFSKFLVDREGNVVKRYGSTTTPSQITKDIEGLL